MLLLDLLTLAMMVLTGVIVITVIGQLFAMTPFVPSPGSVTKAMVETAHLKGSEIVYDLGAGDGKILIQAKKMYPAITARGYEIALGVWLLGLVRIYLSGTKVELHWRDALKQDLRDADVIFLYLMPHMIKRCAKKFDAELKSGTTVISHAFQFHDRIPDREITIPQGKRNRRVFVYRWPAMAPKG